MQQVQLNNLSLWQFKSLAAEAAIRHFVTARSSAGPDKEFTLSLTSTPDKEAVRANRSQLAAAMGVADSRLYLPSQVHKTNIVRVSTATAKEELMETDALITNERGICIAVMSADCVPILLYDKKNEAIGAVHSGWRGTVARILALTLQEMHQTFGTRGEDIIAGIGPSVCQESYEVGEEVVNAFYNEFGDKSGLMIPQPNNKAKLDLWKANKIQLREFGVPESAIELADLCTVQNNDYFFSARKGDAGRFAAGIMLV